MKRLMTTLAVMVMIVTSAAAMSFTKARKEALFLSDKMAYELGLSISQYEAVYEINLDYFLGIYDVTDLDGIYWMRRNADLRYVLSPWQWELYTGIPDFYRPMSWVRRHSFSLIVRNRYAKSYFFYDRPAIYYSFRGGHNIGHDSYYAGREFHRPAAPGGQMHFGSSAPPAYGTVKPNSKSYPSYHIGEAKPATHGTSRSGGTTTNVNTNTNTNKNVNAPATGVTRTPTFSGSQRGNSSTTRSSNTSAAPQRPNNTSAVPQRSTTTTTPQRSTSTTTSGTTTGSGSSRGNSGSTRGNSGGSRGR